MNNGQELASALRGYYGSDTIFFHPINRKVFYTEGFQFFLKNAGGGAYWLLDILATEPAILKGVRELGIVFVRLTVLNGQANLVVNADDGEPPLYHRHISFTDCPEKPVTKDDPKGEWLFYFENMTLMLPSER